MHSILIAALFVGQVSTWDPGHAPRSGSAVLADGNVNGQLCLEDNEEIYWGGSCSAPDVWADFNATSFCLTSTDIDGGGTDGDLFCHTPGEASLDFETQTKYTIPGTVTVTANAATINLANGDLQVLDLQGSTGAVTVTLSNPVTGSWALKVIQGDGADNITWPAAVMWPGGVAPIVSTGEDEIDVVTCIYDGTNHLCTIAQDMQVP